MAQSSHPTKGPEFNNRCSPRQYSVILWFQCKRAKLLLSKTLLSSHEALLKHLSKTRARTKFVASINSPMSALNKPTRPRTFHQVLFNFYGQSCLKRRLRSSLPKSFLKPSFPKFVFVGCHFLKNKLFHGYEARQIEKPLNFLTVIPYVLGNVRCELLTFVTGCTHK